MQNVLAVERCKTMLAEVIQKVYLGLTTAKKKKSNMTLFTIILQVQFK